MANAEVTVAEFFDNLKRQRRADPPQMPTAAAMIELARKALRRERKNGPALLLAAVNYRIGEIAPGDDPWTVINRVSEARQHAGIASSYSTNRTTPKPCSGLPAEGQLLCWNCSTNCCRRPCNYRQSVGNGWQGFMAGFYNDS